MATSLRRPTQNFRPKPCRSEAIACASRKRAWVVRHVVGKPMESMRCAISIESVVACPAGAVRFGPSAASFRVAPVDATRPLSLSLRPCLILMASTHQQLPDVTFKSLPFITLHQQRSEILYCISSAPNRAARRLRVRPNRTPFIDKLVTTRIFHHCETKMPHRQVHLPDINIRVDC